MENKDHPVGQLKSRNSSKYAGKNPETAQNMLEKIRKQLKIRWGKSRRKINWKCSGHIVNFGRP